MISNGNEILSRQRELCLLAAEISGGVTRIPDHHMDKELALHAVTRKGNNLHYLPEKLRDYEVCLKAVSSGADLLDVPESLRDPLMCVYFILNP